MGERAYDPPLLTLPFQRRMGGDEEVPQATEGRKSSRMEGTKSAKLSLTGQSVTQFEILE